MQAAQNLVPKATLQHISYYWVQYNWTFSVALPHCSEYESIAYLHFVILTYVFRHRAWYRFLGRIREGAAEMPYPSDTG